MALDYQKLGEFSMDTFEAMAKAFAEDADPRIEHIMIVVGISVDASDEADGEDDDRKATVFFNSTTKDPFVQMGLARAVSISAEDSWGT